jgi:hypothetical protein
MTGRASEPWGIGMGGSLGQVQRHESDMILSTIVYCLGRYPSMLSSLIYSVHSYRTPPANLQPSSTGLGAPILFLAPPDLISPHSTRPAATRATWRSLPGGQRHEIVHITLAPGGGSASLDPFVLFVLSGSGPPGLTSSDLLTGRLPCSLPLLTPARALPCPPPTYFSSLRPATSCFFSGLLRPSCTFGSWIFFFLSPPQRSISRHRAVPTFLYPPLPLRDRLPAIPLNSVPPTTYLPYETPPHCTWASA